MDSHARSSEHLEMAWAWIMVNRTKVLGALVLIAVAGLGVGLYFWSQQQSRVEASRALLALPPAVDSMRQTNQPTSGEFMEVFEAHARTEAGRNALLVAAGLLFAEGRFDEAEQGFRRYLEQYPDNDVLRSEAAFGVASSLVALGKTEAAVEEHRDLLARYPTLPVSARARLQLALLLEEREDFTGAMKLYTELTEGGGFSSVMQEAMMRRSELLKEHPDLAVAPTPSFLPQGMTAPVGTNPPLTPGEVPTEGGQAPEPLQIPVPDEGVQPPEPESTEP